MHCLYHIALLVCSAQMMRQAINFGTCLLMRSIGKSLTHLHVVSELQW